MKSREDYKDEVRALAEKGAEGLKEIPAYAREELRKAARDGELSEARAREVMHRILLGVEEGLREAGLEARLILMETVDAFVFVFGDIFEQTYDALKSYAESLREMLSAAAHGGEKLRAELEKWIAAHHDEDKGGGGA